MPIEKVLHHIQAQINELAPTLELFVEQTIQPSVKDCDQLQQQLCRLQENIAVYKHKKNNHELSPSFNIHAKLSEKIAGETSPAPVIDTAEEQAPPKPEQKNSPVESEKTTPPKTTKPLTINLNDKFRFINELFAQNNSEYHIAVEQLNNLCSWNETEIYLNSLKNLYGWKENAEVVKYFYLILKKRFD